MSTEEARAFDAAQALTRSFDEELAADVGGGGDQSLGT